MIKPTVGRVVWFHPSTNVGTSGFAAPNEGQPLAAIVARVWSDRMVNLTVFDANGVPHSRAPVHLVQEGEDVPANGHYATWMPYQIGQAKKAEPAPLPLAERPALGATFPGYSTMQPHQQRVVDEKCQLDARLAKLVPFFDTPIFAALDEAEKSRLERQEEAMKAYSGILTERIVAFTAAAGTTV